jgi:adenylate cyclase class 2
MAMDSANLEIKARCADLRAAAARAERFGAQLLGVDEQTDIYFHTRSGRLKLRLSSLSGAQLVPYVRPDERGPKESVYELIPVAHGDKVERLLGELLGERSRVVKRRTIYLWRNVRIHLDDVERLGTFLELEAVFDREVASADAQRANVEALLTHLEIRDGDLLEVSYADLLERVARRERDESTPGPRHA